jgi:SAM-dependent methyltransferase
MPHSPTTRFSNRVQDYIRYRPHYPNAVIDLFQRELNLQPGNAIADIGSGTGILSSLLLDNKFRVFAIEPNREMREAAEKLLAHYNDFTSIDGTAEDTKLPAHSIDLITAAQAFHWFDIEKSREEALRILKPGGSVALLWNDRSADADEFAAGYEALLTTLTDYNAVNHRNTSTPAFDSFFGKDNYRTAEFDNHQDFDLQGLKGRLMSSSYAPVEGDPGHVPMMRELERLFDKYNRNGLITIKYDTKVIYGTIV